ncbi:MAG: aspartate--tRNA(Asn) ligase [Christensenellaceae bacterium]|jgi:aspartyl-tRNA synthetase|nr:aspartate--tRNA(Asn) ligase [Christensenellaceae bacterium]
MHLVRVGCRNALCGEQNAVSGFLENLRNGKNMAFLVLKDASGRLQVTIDKILRPELAGLIEKITIGSVVSVQGLLVENPSVKLGGCELLPDQITIESLAEPLPMAKNANIDTRMDYRWLDLRSDQNLLLFKAQTYMLECLRSFLLEREFIEIHTPKLIAAASESGAEVFELSYFDRKAYLSQSPQFYKQMAMAAGFEKVFEVGPVFRAEKSFTHKHATEFTGFDLELSYIQSFHDVMRLQEEMLASMLKKLAERYGEEIRRVWGIEIAVPALPFPVMKLQDLYHALKERFGYELPKEEQTDLTAEAEKLSFEYTKEVFGHEFLFVTDFPKDKRAFYHMRKDGVPQGYDLIWRGVEITTGAQREHRHELLRAQAEEKGLNEDVKFYLDFFRYGCPPHGGFGMGVDRLTMLLFGLGIKEASFLFRGPNRLTP